MRVFVTGATGYIGTAVSEALRRAGHQVTGAARSADAEAALRSRGDLAVAASLQEPDKLAAAAAKADAVIHAAADLSAADAGAVDRAAVEAMLAALAGSNKPFIYTSGVWVFGDTGGRMLGELGPLNPPPLVAWRPAVEELAVEARDRGVASMVFRPGMVFGRKGGALAGFFGQARQDGVVRFIGSGEQHWSSVHADDLAELYRLAIENPAPGELFIACGGMPQPVRKIALAVAKACGIEGKVEAVPVEIGRQKLGPIADCLAMDLKAGSTKPARFFGWTVRRPSIVDEILSGSYLS
jgi:nucleoside-diphosphate-sugar epimerase